MRLVSIMARSGNKAYPHALSRYRNLFQGRMPALEHRIIVADTKQASEYEQILPEGGILTGAPGKNLEFDAWRHVAVKYADILNGADVVALATSAFENKPDAWLADISLAALEYITQHNMAAGHADVQRGAHTLAGEKCGEWLRTALVFLKPDTLAGLGSLVWPTSEENVFGDAPHPFLEDAPLSPDFREAILGWLCGKSSRYKSRWHGCFELSSATMPLFVSKCTAIINERWLSIRLRNMGVKLADISWLNRALDNGFVGAIPSLLDQTLENGGVFPARSARDCLSPGNREPMPSAIPWGLPVGRAVRKKQQRARPRPAVLYVDKRMLTPDTDSGSLSNFSMLKSYVEMGYEVIFIPDDLVILPEYLPFYLDAGISCLGPEIESIEKYLAEEGGKFDLVFLCRPESAHAHYETVRKYAPRAKLVFYTVDLHFLRMEREAALTGDIDIIERGRQRKTMELDLVRNCDASIVLSEYERELLAEEGFAGKVHHIPILIFNVEEKVPDWEKRGDVMFVGGFSHRPNLDAIVWFCREILPLARKKIPTLRIHVIGSNPPPELRDLSGIPGVIVHGFMENLEPAYMSCRLSVAPLRYGAGIKGKIGQSLAYGLPVISTTVGAESMPRGDGSGVATAKDAADFAKKLVELYKNAEKWRKESAGALKSARETYSPEVNKIRQLRFLEDIGATPPPFVTWPLSSLSSFQKLKELLIHEKIPFWGCDDYCPVCGGKRQDVDRGEEYGEDGTAFCTHCKLDRRKADLIHFFTGRFHPRGGEAVFCTEKDSPTHIFLKELIPFLAGHLPEDARPYNWPDATTEDTSSRLPFADNSFSHAIVFDVPSLVANEEEFFKELARILKGGGTLTFNVPFRKERESTLIRAQRSGGRIIHNLPPLLSMPSGALIYREFGWDILNTLEACGFRESLAHARWINGWRFIFTARKNG